MKKLFRGIMATALGVCMAVPFVGFAACAPQDDGAAKSYVALDINPSVELILDKNDDVISVTAANEDARVLLYGESGIVGEHISVAVDRIASLAEEYGYLSESNAVIGVNVSSVLGEGREAQLQSSINTQCAATSESFDFSVTVSTEGAWSVLRALTDLKAEYPDNEEIQDLTVARFRVILSAQEGDPTLTVEAAVEMDEEELLQMAATAAERVEVYATEAYNAAVAAAERAYEKAKAAVLQTSLSALYTLHSPAEGAIYNMYATAAYGLNFIADAAEYAAQIGNAPFTEEQIARVCAAFGLDETEKAVLEDADEQVTLNSVLAYADRLFKNSPAGQSLEEMKARLDAELEEVAAEVAAEISRLSAEYSEEIEAVLDTAERFADTAGLFVPEWLENYFDEFASMLTTLRASLLDGMTVENLREAATVFEEKKAEVEGTIRTNLSEETLAEIDAVQAKIEEKLDAAKAALEKAVETAKEQAEAYLAACKAARREGTA